MANEDHRPVVVFRNAANATKADTHIFLPIPQSLQFGDSASYNNTELDFGGAVVLGAGRQQTAGAAMDNVLARANAAVPRDLRSLVGLAAPMLVPKGGVESAIGVATGTTRNKNIVTEFSGVGTRQFSFQFKLMSTSRKETKIIKDIVDSFRSGLYPEGNSLQLRYPPTWYINFKQNGKDIPYIPKIFECYLTGLNTTYNASTLMFHPDGSPVEIDIGVSFTESRALTKDDIESLKERAFQDGDFTRVFNSAGEIADKIAENNAKAEREDTAKAEAAKPKS